MMGREGSVAEREMEGLREARLPSVRTRVNGRRERAGVPGVEVILVEDRERLRGFLGGEGMAAPSFWQMDRVRSGMRGP